MTIIPTFLQMFQVQKRAHGSNINNPLHHKTPRHVIILIFFSNHLLTISLGSSFFFIHTATQPLFAGRIAPLSAVLRLKFPARTPLLAELHDLLDMLRSRRRSSRAELFMEESGKGK